MKEELFDIEMLLWYKIKRKNNVLRKGICMYIKNYVKLWWIYYLDVRNLI